MITIEKALSLVQQQEISLQSFQISTSNSLGYALAQDIKSPIQLPGFDNSAMDGYAVCGIHTSYYLKGEIQAGNTENFSLQNQEAYRIFTGAKVPEHTTAILIQEHTEVNETEIIAKQAVTEQQHIRKAGTELQIGTTVFKKGHVLTAASVGLIASLGISEIKVYSKPKVTILLTGDELVELGNPLQTGQIYESNSYSISNALASVGVLDVNIRRVADNKEATIHAIQQALEQTDLLLISGGISVGDYDYVKAALEANAVEEIYYKVAQKPGKPLWFGRKKEKFVFALPGNPASSLSCFYIHVVPLIQKLTGHGHPNGLARHTFPLKEDAKVRSDRPVFLKAFVERNTVRILDGQGSNMIHSMALANALAYSDGSKQLKQGTELECILLP